MSIPGWASLPSWFIAMGAQGRWGRKTGNINTTLQRQRASCAGDDGVDEEGTVVCLGRCHSYFLSSCWEEIFALPWKSFSWLWCDVCVRYKDKQCLITGITYVCLIVLCMNKGFLFIGCWIQVIQSQTFKAKYGFRWSVLIVLEAVTSDVLFPLLGTEQCAFMVAKLLPLWGNPKALSYLLSTCSSCQGNGTWTNSLTWSVLPEND